MTKPKRTLKVNEFKKPEPPKLVTQRTTSEGLIERDIKLSVRKITVTEADYLADQRLGQIKYELSINPHEDAETQRMLINVYAPSAACSRGDVPTPDQLFRMRSADIEFWIKQARELNPNYFLWLSAFEKIINETLTKEEKDKQAKEENKKKGRKRTR